MLSNYSSENLLIWLYDHWNSILSIRFRHKCVIIRFMAVNQQIIMAVILSCLGYVYIKELHMYYMQFPWMQEDQI